MASLAYDTDVYIGPCIHDKWPDFWLLPWANAVNPETGKKEIHVLMQNPAWDVAPPFASFLSGPLLETCLDENWEKFSLRLASYNSLLFHAGLYFKREHAPVLLHHEGSKAFSPDGRQVIFAARYLGDFDEKLPGIYPVVNGPKGPTAPYPKALDEDKKLLGQCNKGRKHVAWCSLRYVMENLCPPSTPSETFKIAGLSLSRYLPSSPDSLPISAAQVYLLERAARHLMPTAVFQNRPPEGGRAWWVSDEQIEELRRPKTGKPAESTCGHVSAFALAV